jgi:hypothetical protein
MSLTVYTLANEAYVPAVVALVNSLRAHGFDGAIRVGSTEPLSIAGADAEAVSFHVLEPSDYWPGNRKAELLLAHPAERFVFLDADMVVTTGEFLPRLQELVELGPVFAIEGVVASVDYRRHLWAERLGRERAPERWPAHYFNSGLFAGLWGRDRALVEAWDGAIRKALRPPGALFTDRDFPTSDQDALNAVLQDYSPPPLGIGPPDIWAAASPSHPFLHVGTFDPPAVLHCTGQDKPWKLTTPPERDPHRYDLAWYQHAVREPAALPVDREVSPALHAWFRRDRLARTLSRGRRVVRRIIGG